MAALAPTRGDGDHGRDETGADPDERRRGHVAATTDELAAVAAIGN